MPRPLLIFSQSDYLIEIFVINLHTWWQTVQIQIRNWSGSTLFAKQGISGFSRTRVKRRNSGFGCLHTSFGFIPKGFAFSVFISNVKKNNKKKKKKKQKKKKKKKNNKKKQKRKKPPKNTFIEVYHMNFLTFFDPPPYSLWSAFFAIQSGELGSLPYF